MSTKELEKQVPTRVGQTVMTTATAACFAGIDSDEKISLGKNLRFFGDGYQISKVINNRRYWRIPVLHGEFICEETTGVTSAIGGGNFLVLSKTAQHALIACEKAIEEIRGAIEKSSRITSKN